MSKESINILIDRGMSVFNEPKKEIVRFTSNLEADKLLSNLEDLPHAYVLGCVMDRQVKAEKAWKIPYLIKENLGTFEIKELLKHDLEFYKKLFKENNLHRFNEVMADCFYNALILIDKKYKGNAENIWNNEKDSSVVIKRFSEFKGVGVKISTMAVNILARKFKIEFDDLSKIDISPDVHTKRVFYRLGLIKTKENDSLIQSARRLNPNYPGVFDYPSWEIGKNWCKETIPDCDNCYLREFCPKLIS